MNFSYIWLGQLRRDGERSQERARGDRGRFVSFSSVVLLVGLLGALFVPQARADGMRLANWKGHLSVGYARLFSDSLAPSGSISVAGGVDYPLSSSLRLGPVIGMSLLGTTDVTRGSVTAGLEYSLFDAALQLQWLPRSGPITRVSLGPGIAIARTALQVGGGGAGFLDLAVDETDPEVALDLSMLPRRQKVVAVGLEAGVRFVPVERVNWWVSTLRLTIHY
jgi:hypothetical protein